MKGILHKDKYNTWWVLYDEVLGESVVKKNQNPLQLHPDDVNELLELDFIFDNLEARVASNPEVDFEIVKVQKLSGIAVYAKLNPHSPSKETLDELFNAHDDEDFIKVTTGNK